MGVRRWVVPLCSARPTLAGLTAANLGTGFGPEPCSHHKKGLTDGHLLSKAHPRPSTGGRPALEGSEGTIGPGGPEH